MIDVKALKEYAEIGPSNRMNQTRVTATNTSNNPQGGRGTSAHVLSGPGRSEYT